jgi:hypothetical protein
VSVIGCNCGGQKSNIEYIYVDSKGVQRTYVSENEAKAAKIRDNNAGTVRAVLKK